MLFRNIIVAIIFLLFLVSCSVISPEIKQQSIPDYPLAALIHDVETYKGKTVILAGLILKVYNEKTHTTLVLLHTAKGFDDSPASKDSSEGRFIVHHPGFIDPEVYSAGRRITVAGRILGNKDSSAVPECLTQCLEIENRQIYLWPEYEYAVPPYYYDAPYPYFYDDFDGWYYRYPPPYYRYRYYGPGRHRYR